MGPADAGESVALACVRRWRGWDAGTGKGARIGPADAGVSVALGAGGRWRWQRSHNGLHGAGVASLFDLENRDITC